MTLVRFTDGESKNFDSVSVKVSGWVTVFDGDDRHHYPPHRIEEIFDKDVPDKDRRERTTHQSPHGRV